jgi:hypothetical protein
VIDYLCVLCGGDDVRGSQEIEQYECLCTRWRHSMLMYKAVYTCQPVRDSALLCTAVRCKLAGSSEPFVEHGTWNMEIISE